MKNALIFLAVLFILPCVGFFLQWLRWEIIPTIKDKIKAKKIKKSYEKRLTNQKACGIIKVQS